MAMSKKFPFFYMRQHPYNACFDRYLYKILGNLPILLTGNVSPPGSQFNVTILASTGGEDTVTYDITNTKTDGECNLCRLSTFI